MEKGTIVTPWRVEGKVDYNKLIEEFGVEKINNKIIERIKKHTKEIHFMLKRGIFFAHRDLNWILNEYEKGNRFFLYTGRSPSGKIHLGHLVPWMFTKWLQDRFNAELWFQFPNEEKFLFKKDLTFEKAQEALYENMIDVIALGFDQKKTHFLINTTHANLMYEHACKVAKKITFSMVKSSFGFDESTNIGAIFYTSMQAVPALLPSVMNKKNIPCLIPLGFDQDPHFRLTRDIMPKLGYYKPAIIHSIFLPPLCGTSGKTSSSSSNNHVIFTTDDEKTVARKIQKYAFSGGQPTIEEHRKLGGNPDVDVCYQYLRILLEENDEKLNEIYSNYKSGKMLTGELKQYTINKINSFLKEHQKKREAAKKQIENFIYRTN